MGFEFFEEHRLSDASDYEAVLHDLRDEHNTQMLVMHIEVCNFSPSVLKRMKREFETLRSCTDALLFAIEPNPDDAKWERFVRIMGFEFSSRVECTDGRSRRCFVSKKKNNDDLNDQHATAAAVCPVDSPAAVPRAGVRSGSDKPI